MASIMRTPTALRSLSTTWRSPAISASRILPTRTSRVSTFGSSRRYASDTTSAVIAPDYLDESERKIFSILKENFQPEKLEVQDISGGCGSMYALDIVSDQFKGLTVIKQHRLVNKVLGEEIKKWHGVQLKTKAP